ncbi:MAG: hypothetical protein KDB03_22640 [Planctomycetales bacterium]|nr:hypothetical protein [Planctomycetales bacterium]
MTTNSTETKKAKPVFRKLLPNGISAAVFENEYEGRTYRSVNLQRSYRKDGEWKRMSMYIDHEHIPFLIEALQGTWNFLNSSPVAQSVAESETIEIQDEATIDA